MMIRRAMGGFQLGYTPVVEDIHNTKAQSMRLNFGILRLAAEDVAHTVYNNSESFERLFLLIQGSVTFRWYDGKEGATHTAQRINPLDGEPVALHVPQSVAVEIAARSPDAELSVQMVANSKRFASRIIQEGDYQSAQFGKGAMQETSTRVVRTFFDAASTSYSEMVVGEVINQPGKWSSYPPHHHAQPEIYHFRFFPKNGFGYSEQGEDAFKIHDGDTACILPNVTHPQTAAPGYALYYIWAIPHLPDNRFGPDSRIFEDEHTWLLNDNAVIWPDAPLAAVIDAKER